MIEEMLTIRPARRSRMVGSTRRAMRAGAIRLVSSCRRTCSSSTSSIAPGWAKPALLTTAQGPPSVIVAISVKALTVDVGSVTSSSTVRTAAPVRSTSLRRPSAFSSLRTLPITSKPACASSRVTARPIPLAGSGDDDGLGTHGRSSAGQCWAVLRSAGRTNGHTAGKDPAGG